jgi:phosphatidylserine decarboxylase
MLSPTARARGSCWPGAARFSLLRSQQLHHRTSALRTISSWRAYSHSHEQRRQNQRQHQEPFGQRLRQALRNTKIEWYQIPIGLGIGFLGFFHFYRLRRRENALEQDAQARSGVQVDDEDPRSRKRRQRIRPSGPWSVFSTPPEAIAWPSVYPTL